jgi:hypothetical protein
MFFPFAGTQPRPRPLKIVREGGDCHEFDLPRRRPPVEVAKLSKLLVDVRVELNLKLDFRLGLIGA